MFEEVAKATLKIECEKKNGSGFHLLDTETVVTNFHIIEPHLTEGEKIFVKTENGEKVECKLHKYSPDHSYDYAILKINEPLKEERNVLEPKIVVPSRGMKVCFSGFPHGIDDLLVQAAYVSGPFENLGFYIDGTVNGGNSGGPVVDLTDMKVIGIITQRRFLTPLNFNSVNKTLNTLNTYLKTVVGRGAVNIMGIDFAQFAKLMSDAFDCFKDILMANANTGIGIAYNIEFVAKQI